MARGKPDKWKTVHIKRDGKLLTAHLHPIGTVGNTRYWSFTCREAGIRMKSLKVETYADALNAAHEWFDKEPERTEREQREQAILTWEDWEAIQVAHTRKRSEKNQRRAEKTLEECRKAQRLFVRITNAESASAVDADMVEQFMSKCGQTRSKLGENYKASGIRKTLGHMSA